MYAPQPQNDPNDETGPNGLRQAGAGAPLLTTTKDARSVLEMDALTQARQAIAHSELPYVASTAAETPAALETGDVTGLEGAALQHQPPTILNALHCANTIEREEAAQTTHALLDTLLTPEQQKQSVDNMIALLLQETHIARRRRRNRRVKNSLVLLGVVWLLWVTHGRFFGNFWWLFNLGGGWWAIEQSTKRRETISELSKAGDPRAVGALAIALRDGDKSIQHTASEALLALLPRVRASHAAHITPDQMNALLELAFRSNFWMQLAVLKALEQIGDQRAIPLVQNLALSPHKAVRDQANQCLPFLMQRARQAEQSATLLRGAASPGATAGGRELLRPATSAAAYDSRPDELLRPTDTARFGY